MSHSLNIQRQTFSVRSKISQIVDDEQKVQRGAFSLLDWQVTGSRKRADRSNVPTAFPRLFLNMEGDLIKAINFVSVQKVVE